MGERERLYKRQEGLVKNSFVIFDLTDLMELKHHEAMIAANERSIKNMNKAARESALRIKKGNPES